MTAQLWQFAGKFRNKDLVTATIGDIAEYRYKHVNYYTNQQVTLDHFFIQNWDLAREIEVYPPSTGKLAVYGKEEFFNYIDFAVNSWANIETDALGPFFRNSSL